MPRVCENIREFLEKFPSAEKQEAESKRVVHIFEKRTGNKSVTKFKVKTTSGGLYTMTVADRSKASKIEKILKKQNVEINQVGKLRQGKAKKAM